MRPVRTFLQQNSIRALLGAEKVIYSASHGALAKNRFLSALKIPHIETDVKIIKETDTSTFIAKFDGSGKILDSDFKILNSTDIHMGEDSALIVKSLQLLLNQIRDEKPDLVIFTGDVILSKYQQIDAIQFAQMMEQVGVYWAYVFGNHEARKEKEYFKYLIMRSLSNYPHCLTKFGKPELFGYGNFIINIMNGGNSLSHSLVLFDSGRDICEPHRSACSLPSDMKGYDFIKPSQIEWYSDEVSALKAEFGETPQLLYMHIPIKEYENVFEADGEGHFVPTGKAEILYGSMYESVGSSPHNSGLFAAMKANGALAVFSGHDHVNDFAAKYEGIWLVYNQCGGYDTYTMGDYNGVHWAEKDWQQGVTVTLLHSDGSLELQQKYNSKYL